jgi:hypothetical protein
VTFHDLPRCEVRDPETDTHCENRAETLGYCVPCWVQMDLEGIPDGDPDDTRWHSAWESDAAAARECG